MYNSWEFDFSLFVISSKGIVLLDVYTGAHGVLTGSARLAQEAKERADQVVRQQETQRKQLELDRKRAAVDAQIAALQASFELEREQVLRDISLDQMREQTMTQERDAMGRSRKADDLKTGKPAPAPAGNGVRARRPK